jgi:hypothetical protein
VALCLFQANGEIAGSRRVASQAVARTLGSPLVDQIPYLRGQIHLLSSLARRIEMQRESRCIVGGMTILPQGNSTFSHEMPRRNLPETSCLQCSICNHPLRNDLLVRKHDVAILDRPVTLLNSSISSFRLSQARGTTVSLTSPG